MSVVSSDLRISHLGSNSSVRMRVGCSMAGWRWILLTKIKGVNGV